jgi:hypothetical protein
MSHQRLTLERLARTVHNLTKFATAQNACKTTILQGDGEDSVRYIELPRKAANAEEWIASQAPALASAGAVRDKLN